MSNREEKEKAWREEFMNYFSSSGNRYPKSIMESYLAGRKAGQEEIDRLSDVITISNRYNDDQYAKKNEIILALENRLEEKKEEVESKKSLFLSMSKKQRDDKDLIDRLRAELESIKDTPIYQKCDLQEREIHRLKDLVKRAKPYVQYAQTDSEKELSEVQCWIEASGEIGGWDE